MGIKAAKKFAEIVNADGRAIAKVWTQGDKVRVYLTWPKGGQMGYQDFARPDAKRDWACSGDQAMCDFLLVARDTARGVE